MATKILINAVNGQEKSQPFVAYLTKDEADLPKQFVVRLDDTVNRDDEPQLRVSNANIGIIVSHQPEYLTDVLTGYRRKVEDTTVVICERFKDDLPSLKSLAKSEVF